MEGLNILLDMGRLGCRSPRIGFVLKAVKPSDVEVHLKFCESWAGVGSSDRQAAAG